MAPLGTLLTALVTPFRPSDGAVDEDAFVAIMRHVLDAGSDGVVVCGSTGESATMTDEEQLRVIELAVQNRPAGKTVIAGTGSNETRHAVHLTQEATALGPDGILSVTPYYNRPSPAGLIRHYEEVAKATDLPVLLYNIPIRCGIDVPNDLLARLGQIDHIAGVKQSNADSLALIDGLDLYAGDDENFARVLDMGGAGVISVAGHVVSPLLKQMAEDPARRAEIDERLKPLYSALFCTSNPTPVKAALNLLGFAAGTLRLPLVDADERETAIVRGALEGLGLLAWARQGEPTV